MNLRRLTLFLIFFCCGEVFADVGCMTASGNVYFKKDPLDITANAYAYYVTADYLPPSRTYCVTATSVPNTPCHINFYNAGNEGTISNAHLVNFSTVNCPLDDHLPIFILVSMALGGYAVRSKIQMS